jgi:hypothetical protein
MGLPTYYFTFMLHKKKPCDFAAIQNRDYQFATTSIILPPGTGDGDLRCLNITILDDDLIEGDEIFTLRLRITAGNGVTLGRSTTTVTITEDDSKQEDYRSRFLGQE